MFEKWAEKQIKRFIDKHMTPPNMPPLESSGYGNGYRVIKAKNGWVLVGGDAMPRVATSDSELIEQLTADLAYNQLAEGIVRHQNQTGTYGQLTKATKGY